MSKSQLPKLNKCKIGIIGLGYVGLPLAIKIANQNFCLRSNKRVDRDIVGYDTNEIRVSELKKGIDRNKIFSKKILTQSKNIYFTNNLDLLKNIDVFIITVPTPINLENKPDLYFLKKASKLLQVQ